VPSVQRFKKKQVWAWALDLLLKFQWQFGTIESPPVPLDDILRFLGLQLEFDDICVGYGLSGHLGFTAAATRQIFIDQSLDPMEHPEMEGRLNFTIAHEIAHWRLHRHIPGYNLLPDHEKYWGERQADWFAAYLLMPPHLVLEKWEARVGHAGALVITREQEAIGIENFGSRAAFLKALEDLHASALAPLFKVSREAMGKRLRELGLLPK
jgi:hypothetical protein